MRINLINHSTGNHFDELLAAYQCAINNKGLVIQNDKVIADGINIVFGANVLALNNHRIVYPNNTIIINLEQLSYNKLWDSTFYLDYLLAYPTIDYSLENVNYLKAIGKKEDIVFVPVRYADCFNIGPVPESEKEIDVLILGARGEKRVKFTRELRKLGWIVAYATDCWGADRVNILSKSKLVVNLRNSYQGILETTRLSILISSGIQCISESSNDKNEDNYYSQFISIVPQNELIKYIDEFLYNHYNRISQQNKDLFKEDSYTKRISDAFEQIVSNIDYTKKPANKYNLHWLLENGCYITSRETILSHKNKSPSQTTHILDYLLHQHDRIHDVEDNLILSKNLTPSYLSILTDLLGTTWIPVSLTRKIEQCILINIQLLNTPPPESGEYFKKSICGFLAKQNEIYLFIKWAATLQDSFDFIKSFIPKFTVSNIIWHDVASLVTSSNIFHPEVKYHLAAEIYWNIECNQLARDCYRQTTKSCSLTSDHYHQVATRLTQYGDTHTALTYFEKSQLPFDGIPVHENSYTHSNSFNPVSTEPQAPEKIITALERNLSNKIFLSKNVENNKSSIYIGTKKQDPNKLALDGAISIYDQNIHISNGNQQEAVAIIACYNEVDIIEPVIHKFISSDIKVHVIDNWSTDGTYELLTQLSKIYQIKIERYPLNGPTDIYDWTGLLALKEQIALQYKNHWIIHTDADEIRITPWHDINLLKGLSIVDSYGCNAIDYIILNFRPVDNGFIAGLDPECYFGYFEIAQTSDLKYQIKTWKQGEHKVDLVSRGGHCVKFEGRKIFPYKFICKHYPLRSIYHANKKIYQERISRFSKEEKLRGWHSHYDSANEHAVINDWKKLYRWDEYVINNISPMLIHGC